MFILYYTFVSVSQLHSSLHVWPSVPTRLIISNDLKVKTERNSATHIKATEVMNNVIIFDLTLSFELWSFLMIHV